LSASLGQLSLLSLQVGKFYWLVKAGRVHIESGGTASNTVRVIP